MLWLQLKDAAPLRRWTRSLLLVSVLTLVLVAYVNYTYMTSTCNYGLADSRYSRVCPYSSIDARVSVPLSRDGMPSRDNHSPKSSMEPDHTNNNNQGQITSLIDIPLNFNFTHTERNVKYTILWYNPADWLLPRMKTLRMDTCEYNNCNVTVDLKLFNVSTAVVFGISMMDMGLTPPVSQQDRNPDQIWVYYSLEAPIYHIFATDYIYGDWKDTMNWSMTYNLDSDVFSPYGTFRTRHKPYNNEPDYNKIYDMKNKMAVWVVSNCRSMSKRTEFVSALQDAGIEVDIFGNCGKLGRYKGDIQNLTRRYKFYLSMENSFCKDYVTEKVMQRYNDDVIMVIRGGADYTRLIPNYTYVDAAMLKNVTSLAKYLHALSSNRTRYIEMLQNKYKYYTLHDDFNYDYAMCNLCKKLNKHDGTRKTYSHLRSEVLKEGRCIRPNDIVVE